MRIVITPFRLLTVLSVSLSALLASPAKVIYDNFGIAEGPVTTVHTITAHIRARVANLYDGHIVAQYIVSASTDH